MRRVDLSFTFRKKAVKISNHYKKRGVSSSIELKMISFKFMFTLNEILLATTKLIVSEFESSWKIIGER